MQEPKVFDQLITESMTFFSKKDRKITEYNSYSIHLDKSISDLKLKGFKEALGEAIRYLFYVSLALSKGEVIRKTDDFDSATRIFESISPIASGYISNEKFGFKTNLAFGMLNIIFEYIKSIRDANIRESAERIVNAFQGGYGRINVQKLKEITRAMGNRFRDQIFQMTISLSTDGNLRLHEEDGVVKFANVIAERIGSHLMKNCNKFADSSTLNSLKKNIEVFFIEAQNIKAPLPLPTLERCFLATWQELNGYDVLIDCDRTQNRRYVKWLAGDILTQTGIRDIENPNFVTKRDGNFNHSVGYIYASKEEAKMRKYEEFSNSQNTEQENNPNFLAVIK